MCKMLVQLVKITETCLLSEGLTFSQKYPDWSTPKESQVYWKDHTLHCLLSCCTPHYVTLLDTFSFAGNPRADKQSFSEKKNTTKTNNKVLFYVFFSIVFYSV